MVKLDIERVDSLMYDGDGDSMISCVLIMPIIKSRLRLLSVS